MPGASTPRSVFVAGATPPASADPFATSPRFGHRYHLIRLLGTGGMGAVYQAWDEELSVVVAIKVIRPDAMADPAAARDLERRFKRELLLARNVTHKNVVRIHDLGEVEGVKYITMPYVNGVDLATVLKREGRLPVARAVAIARQVASGLVAAHDAGVVHRDLKPANILLDEDDHALITDFGIARSTSGGAGHTVAGTVVGTLEYMAPEQARGETADHRADIYAFGLMLSDMLVGRRQPKGGESAVAELLERMTRPVASPRTVDPSIPPALDDIVCRAADPDPGKRYQHTQDLLADLEALQTERRPSGVTHPVLTPVGSDRSATITLTLPRRLPGSRRTWVAAALLIAAVAGAGVIYRTVVSPAPAGEGAPSAVQGQSVSLAVLPFRNASGSSSLDWLGPSLAETLRSEVGQSASLRVVPSDRLSQILDDLKVSPNETLDPATLSRLAEFSSADTVVWGQYVKFGNEIRIDATLQDVRQRRTIPLKASAANESELLGSITRLAAAIRENLALSDDAIKQLAATAFKPSTGNVRALRYYNEGVTLSRQGKHTEALTKFQASTGEDSNFALAHAKHAQAHAALGRMDLAERLSRQAVSLSDGLPAAERQLILATHASILNDRPKAIEYYEALDKAMPGNEEVQFALASLYKDTGAYDNARTRYAQLLERDPKYVDALLGAGQVENWSGRANEALEYLNRALTIAIQRGNDEARAAVLRTLGGTYAALHKPGEALRHYQDSLEIERRLSRTSGIAESLHAIAQMKDDAGESEAALATYREALDLRRSIGDKQGVGNVLNDLGSFFAARGRYEEALTQFQEALQVQREVRNPVYEAGALNNIGYIYLSLGRYDDAQTYLQQAVAIRQHINVPGDVADTLHNLAEVSVRKGAYDAAQGHYLKALELWRQVGNRRATAIELYNLGDLFEYQGRFGAAVDSKAEAVQIFKELGDRGSWLPKVIASYGSALGQSGRFAEAQKVLDEALPLARELRNDELLAEILNAHGDVLYYQGDFKGARSQYAQAHATAVKTKLRPLQLRSRLNLARLDGTEGRAGSAGDLRGLVAETERLGLKFEAVRGALLAAEADIRRNDRARAREQLESALAQSERLGARTLLAQAHHMLASIDAAQGNQADARRHVEAARQLVEAIRKDARGDEVLRRPDLQPILESPTQ